MSDVLGVLTAKAVTEAEEAQRALIGAYNGLAALDVLQDRLQDAVRCLPAGRRCRARAARPPHPSRSSPDAGCGGVAPRLACFEALL